MGVLFGAPLYKVSLKDKAEKHRHSYTNIDVVIVSIVTPSQPCDYHVLIQFMHTAEVRDIDLLHTHNFIHQSMADTKYDISVRKENKYIYIYICIQTKNK